MRLAVLVPAAADAAGSPEDWPLGRAALRLHDEGIDVLFASTVRDGRLAGHRAARGRWLADIDDGVAGALDRFPARSRPEEWRALREALGDRPLVNAPAATALCDDKLATAALWAAAGLATPDIETEPARFGDAAARWGTAFHKPRYGALGRGIRRVSLGDPLPHEAEGAVPGVMEPAFVQRAVKPPEGWAGAAVRVLVQRVGAGWVAPLPVVRRSRTDPVANAARGAIVEVAAEVLGDIAGVVSLAVRAADVLDVAAGGIVELGIDLVVDGEGQPWLLEANGRPRGRLEVIAARDERWQEEHVEATARPLRALAARVQA
jgi:glutathione synthase/RimK-type ligase-like ATP-grasp enzyme